MSDREPRKRKPARQSPVRPASSPATEESIAIVGMACRFPGGANSPEEYWRMLIEGRDAICDIPPSRWNVPKFYDPDPHKPGKTYLKRGGYIENIDGFDAAFFGISPREATRMDPQQRLLLEVAWESLEDAGQAIDRKGTTPAGVFIGISSLEYSRIQTSLKEMDAIETHTGTGVAYSIASNRISHALNLVGPSVSVDTACSSALVATHLACESIRRGDCDMALAGGISLLLNPETYVIFCKLSMLSPDGVCKVFDADANGFVRSEGVGIAVLKPLSRAVEDKDRIYAVIPASGSNQDGHTPGITIPSGAAQEALIRRIYARAGIDPKTVSYIEAHGTGTAVGDPIETNALGAAFGAGRPANNPCLVGSVKTNMGHLEAAAGIAGLMKAVLVAGNRAVPPNLHFKRPNPAIDFERLRLKVPVEVTALPAGKPVVVSVNSFGFGGTNAHVIVTSPPDIPAAARPAQSHADGSYEVFCLSGHTQDSLRELAARCREFAAGPAWAHRSLRSICKAADTRRSRHQYRVGIAASSKEELASLLETYARGEAAPGIVSGSVSPAAELKMAFVFSGQGPQWWAMGRELLNQERVFKDMIVRCDGILGGYSDWSLLDELCADEQSSRMDNTAISQPAIFALQAALTSLWASWGVEPSATVGHSVGEVAAAWAAGALSLEDALLVICHRGRCMSLAPATGAMLAVGLAAKDVEPFLAGCAGKAAIAAFNSPNSVTVSGDGDAVDELEKALNARNVFCRRLRVNYAFHSHHMDGIKSDLLASLKGIKTSAPAKTLYSTVSGRRAAGGDFDDKYWWSNVRCPVNFAGSIEGLAGEGYNVFVEISPHPVLSSQITECVLERGHKAVVVPSLRRKEPERRVMLSSLAMLHNAGAPVDWSRLYPGRETPVPFPRYPWAHESYWYQSDSCRNYLLAPPGNPLLGERTDSPSAEWESCVNERMPGFLADHVIRSQPIFPATGYVELALACAAAEGVENFPVIENLDLQKGIFLSGADNRVIRTAYNPTDLTFTVHSRPEFGKGAWQLHASGSMLPPEPKSGETLPLDAARSRCTETLDAEACYARLRTPGYEYGPAFRGIVKLYCGNLEAVGEIVAPAAIEGELDKYQCHPAMLDSCFQTIGGAVAMERNRLFLPVRIGRLRLHRAFPKRVWSCVRDVRLEGDTLSASITILDDNGAVLAEVRDFVCRVLDEQTASAETPLDDLLYDYQWTPRPIESDMPAFAETPETVAALNRAMSEMQATASTMHFLAEPKEMKDLCSAYICNALLDLGWAPGPETGFTAESAAESLGIRGLSVRRLGRFFQILEENGMLERRAGLFHAASALKRQDSDELWRAVLSRHPSLFAELMLLHKCGRRLADVLTEKTNALELVFPPDDLSFSEFMYRDSSSARNCNLLLQLVTHRLATRVPRTRKLRIVEIGAGTGGTTGYVLPEIADADVEYVFTDISPAFAAGAEKRFSEYGCIRFSALDIEKDPCSQGFEPHSFDVAICSEVLHATENLGQSLEHVRRLLCPGGVLLIAEFMPGSQWLDLVFGLLDGWWRFSDFETRRDHPAISLAQWRHVLKNAGFAELGSFAPEDEKGRVQHSAVIAVRSPLAPAAPPCSPAAPDKPWNSPGKWLVFSDKGQVGSILARMLREKGETCVLAARGPAWKPTASGACEIPADSADAMKALLKACSEAEPEGPLRGIVHLWSLDLPRMDALKTSQIDEALDVSCMNPIRLVQGMLAGEDALAARLWLVTRGAQSVGKTPEAVSAIQAALWGLGRVIASEFPKSASVLVDLEAANGPHGNSDADARIVLSELLCEEGEDEVAFRGGLRHVNRFRRNNLATPRNPQFVPRASVDEEGFRLAVAKPGVIDKLAVRRAQRRPPRPGEIEIEVHAAGVNFSDVLKTLNLYPGLSGGDIPIGIECAGVVSRLGPDTDRWQIGQSVMAFTGFCFASHVTVSGNLAMPVPGKLSFAEAATIPVAFLTAYHALVHEGAMKKGERVLVHVASGGVGLAAIQIARHIGAEVFATAGTPEKRRFLRDMGIAHVMDSRTLAFAREIMEVTGGEGVDLVLNSLAGEGISKGLSVLKNNGRFLELGKRDVFADKRIGLGNFKKNVSFRFIDFDAVFRENPALIGEHLKALHDGFVNRAYTPLPLRVFPMSMAGDAFRHMAKARHIGKIVLTTRDHLLRVALEPVSAAKFKSSATYLITGGFGGFGLAVAEWLADSGAKHLALMGRKGPATVEARQRVAEIERKGATIRTILADVADERDLMRALSEIRQSMPPLRGVVHAAMVLEDYLLPDLTLERFRKVTDPKIKGAWNLHLHTSAMPLDFFVLFSSLTSVIGRSGQANYSAANSFLDMLAFYRRAKGLPALTVNWGFLGQVGYLARTTKTARRIEQEGIRSFTPQQALNALGRFMKANPVQMSVLDLNWTRFAEVFDFYARSPKFAHLTASTDRAGGRPPQGDGSDLLRILAATAAADRPAVVESALLEQAARVLGTKASKLDPEKPLTELGFDSLMAVELRNWIEGNLRVTIPAMEMMRGPSVRQLAARLLELYSGATAGGERA